MSQETWWVGLIEALIVPNLLLLAFAYTTWFERKLLSRMQLRYGPNRAGKFGLVQPFADMIKLLYKEALRLQTRSGRRTSSRRSSPRSPRSSPSA